MSDKNSMRPGLSAEITSTPRRVLYKDLNIVKDSVVIGSAARDSGATTTTKLRAGLVLGRKTADGKYYQYNDSASDGTETARLILAEETNLLDENADAQDREAPVIVAGGLVDQDQCIGLDDNARTDLSHIQFKDSVVA